MTHPDDRPKQGTAITNAPREVVTLGSYLGEHEARIQALAPAGVPATRIIQAALVAVAQNENLKKCTPSSILLAVMQATKDGLEIGVTCALVPRGGVAVYQKMYKGRIQQAVDAGAIHKIETRAVYSGDDFTIHYGTASYIEHIPDHSEARGTFIGAYAIAWLPRGYTIFEYMTRAEIDKVRMDHSDAPNSPAWKKDYEMMGRKTVGNRLLERLSVHNRARYEGELEAETVPRAPRVVGHIDAAFIQGASEGEYAGGDEVAPVSMSPEQKDRAARMPDPYRPGMRADQPDTPPAAAAPAAPPREPGEEEPEEFQDDRGIPQ